MAKWHSRRRFLSWSWNDDDWTVFYCDDELDQSEFSLLAETLNKVSYCEDSGDTRPQIRLEPSLADEPARFLELQRDWSRFLDDFPKWESGDDWERKTCELFNEACEFEKHLRELRKARCRTWYLCVTEMIYPPSSSDEFHVVAKISHLTDGEIKTLETLLSPYARDWKNVPHAGAKWAVEFISEDDAVFDRTLFVQLQRKLRESNEQNAQGEEPEWEWVAADAREIIKDIIEAREKVIDDLAFDGEEGAEREAAVDGPNDAAVDQPQGNGEAEPQLAASANGADLSTPLKGKYVKALDFIKSRPNQKALVIAKHIDVSESHFRKVYLPVLRPHGVYNDRDGYYWKPIDGSSTEPPPSAT